MAFTSYDQIIAAATGTGGRSAFFNKSLLAVTTPAQAGLSTWGGAGFPAAGTYGTALTSRQCTSATQGAISLPNAAGGEQLYMTSYGLSSTLTSLGSVMPVDRLLDYGGIAANVATTQTMTNSATLPTEYSTGEGVMMFVEVQAVGTGVTNNTITISYTNQAGTSGRTTAVSSLVAAPAQGRLLAPVVGFFVPLQAGDTGVRSVESVTLTAAATSGTYCVVLCKPYPQIPVANVYYVERELIQQTPRLPTVRNDDCLQFLICAASTTATSNWITGEFNGVSG
jgi:hypothetical protein